MSKKVLEMGGNAVLGYYQSFDMEGDSGIVARCLGTCVFIEKRDVYSGDREITPSPRMANIAGDSSDNEKKGSNDVISTNRYNLSEAAAAAKRHRESIQGEVQLLTMKEFGHWTRVRIGGLVTARSVKYLGKLASKLSDQGMFHHRAFYISRELCKN